MGLDLAGQLGCLSSRPATGQLMSTHPGILGEVFGVAILVVAVCEMRWTAQDRGLCRESFVISRPTDQPRLAQAAQRDVDGSRIARHTGRGTGRF